MSLGSPLKNKTPVTPESPESSIRHNTIVNSEDFPAINPNLDEYNSDFLNRTDSDTRPIYRLLTAMLWRAILDLHHFQGTPRRSALKWLNSNSHREFSYFWVTEALDLDPEKLRNYIFSHKIDKKRLRGH